MKVKRCRENKIWEIFKTQEIELRFKAKPIKSVMKGA